MNLIHLLGSRAGEQPPSPVGWYMTILWVLLKANVFHQKDAGGTWGGFGSKQANDSRPHLPAALCAVSDESVEHLLTCVQFLSNIWGRDHSDSVMCCYHKETTCSCICQHYFEPPSFLRLEQAPVLGDAAGETSPWHGRHLVWRSSWDQLSISSSFFH